MWAYCRGQTDRHTDTHTQTHRRAWPQYILRRLRLTQNVIIWCYMRSRYKTDDIIPRELFYVFLVNLLDMAAYTLWFLSQFSLHVYSGPECNFISIRGFLATAKYRRLKNGRKGTVGPPVRHSLHASTVQICLRNVKALDLLLSTSGRFHSVLIARTWLSERRRTVVPFERSISTVLRPA